MSLPSIIEQVVESIIGQDIETIRRTPISERKYQDSYRGLQVTDRSKVLTSQQVNRMVDAAIGYNSRN